MSELNKQIKAEQAKIKKLDQEINQLESEQVFDPFCFGDKARIKREEEEKVRRV